MTLPPEVQEAAEAVVPVPAPRESDPVLVQDAKTTWTPWPPSRRTSRTSRTLFARNEHRPRGTRGTPPSHGTD